MLRRDKPPRREVTRPAAFAARPVPLPVRERRADEKGELHLTLEYDRPRWQQWLGADARCRRTFVLDAPGRAVYEQCDGRRSVREIADALARARQVSAAEAEHSVAAYLRTLTAKGLLALQLDEERA